MRKTAKGPIAATTDSAQDALRLDAALVARGLAETRNRAQRLIKAGSVMVNGKAMTKNATTVLPIDDIVISDEGLRFVGRGGEKLAFALEWFGIGAADKICVDIGSSTGGFTDCLLQNGARKVFAIDVGTDQLAKRLKQDPRVISMEQTDIRAIERLPDAPDLVVMDVSFISLKLVMPAMRRLISPATDIIALIKPQFEGDKRTIDRHGIVKDPMVRTAIVQEVMQWLSNDGWHVVDGPIKSPIVGGKGNIEYLIHLRCPKAL